MNIHLVIFLGIVVAIMGCCIYEGWKGDNLVIIPLVFYLVAGIVGYFVGSVAKYLYDLFF